MQFMSFSFTRLWEREPTRDITEAMRWPSVNPHLAASHVSNVLDWNDRWEPITDIEDYQEVHKIWTFKDWEGFYFDGSF